MVGNLQFHIFEELFEIEQVLFNSARKVGRIEDRTDLQRYFGSLVGTRLEAHSAGHEAVREGAPCNSAVWNLKDDLEDTSLFVAVRLPDEGKVSVIDSSHISQRRNEFRQLLNARPLFVHFRHRSIHNGLFARRVHNGRARFVRKFFFLRRRSAHNARSRRPDSSHR